MASVTSKRRKRARFGGVVVAVLVCHALQLPGTAEARPYTVVSCDSAALFGYSSAAWVPFGSAGRAYAACPSGHGEVSGISNRLTGVTYTGFSGSGHAFTAPEGATITHVRWAGRLAREACYWGAYIRALPSAAAVVGAPQNQYCGTMAADTRQIPMTFATPAGTTRLEQLVVCGASQCRPGATFHSQTLEVTIDDPVPPSISLSGPLASGQWVSGRVGDPYVDVVASDNAGVQRIDTEFGISSEAQGYACNWSQARPCPDQTTARATPNIANRPDGRHVLRVSGVDAAGNSTAVIRDVYVDNTPPDPVVPQLADGLAWRRTNGFAISWTNPSNNASPIVRAHWKLCTGDGNCATRGSATGQGIQRLPLLNVPAAGEYLLRVWLEDGAGNQREAGAAVTVPLRFDGEAPRLAFQAQDPEDPLRVSVEAADRHSGVAHGEIEMRAVGNSSWHGLATDVEGGRLVAYVDDERFRNGTYEFRAHAVDHAGNEASTGRTSEGYAARIRLPARVETTLSVGIPRTTVRRRVVHRHGTRRVVRRLVRRLDGHVVARHQRSLRLTGFLTNLDGQPLDGATVEALERRPGGTSQTAGFATTDGDGRFRYMLRAVRNRELVFHYAGSRRIGSAEARFTLLVPAATSMEVDRPQVANGQRVVFDGRVWTRPLPATGKLVEMQAHFRGKWRTFSTVRTARSGRWRFPYRFGATRGRVTYRFRARLPAEGGYPFIGGYSPVVEVVVVGL